MEKTQGLWGWGLEGLPPSAGASGGAHPLITLLVSLEIPFFLIIQDALRVQGLS